MEVLHDGKYPLLKRYIKDLHRASSVSGFETKPGKLEMIEKVVYYLGQPQGGAAQVKLNLKGMQQAAPGLAASLAAVPGANRATTEADWAAVLKAADPR
ncbi:hypothetical protein ACFQT0_18525 [Hymenobacter humi]|uniref:Uncharacterized protein n=1 Tax=Hymenobacter humi TaxID=1411620 RepID=A0ABW2U6M5_9BACT